MTVVGYEMRISEIEPVLGASRLDVGNWLSRLTMTSPFEDVVSGQARQFGYQNVIELALISAFVSAGISPSKSVAWARPFVGSAAAPGIRHGDAKEWLVIPAGNHSRATATDRPDLDSLAELLVDGMPPVLALVNIGHVFRRVDALFGAQG